MKKSIKTIIMVAIAVLTLGLSTSFVGAEGAIDQVKIGVDAVTTGNTTTCLLTGLPDTCTNGIVTKFINYALIAVGALSVIMLIYGGIRYTISAGDAKQVESAKNTILYALIGIIVALLAGAIVNFVIGAFTGA